MELKTARWWHKLEGTDVQCELCPHNCVIKEGKVGICFLRMNVKGELKQLGYNHPTAVAIDPIEKKPLYHFLPGSQSFSLGNVGCNLKCSFCQNHDISFAKANTKMSRELTVEQAVELAQKYDCQTIAYTYNEPTIWAEYAIDISKAALTKEIRSVAVSNGYISDVAFHDFYSNIHGVNVDLKAFTDEFYATQSKARLAPVLNTLKRIKNETDVMLEITSLLIPTLNDSVEEIKREVGWILENLGADVPLHFSAFHPDNKLLDLPRTPEETILRSREIAMNAGLHYVYTGNIINPDGSTTFCPSCKKPVIKRNWLEMKNIDVDKDGKCKHCGTKIAGVFS